ncbi:MAG: tetratricopeptide repeat protein, partial [Chloroflexi bacterium]|nr:tetratricopeptide repeat protein [Chloroflexota bacterium]
MEGANELLARSIRDPGNAETLAEAGSAYLDAHLYEVAKHCLERAESKSIQDGGRAAFLLGQCEFQNQDYARSAQAFDRAVTQGWPRAKVAMWQAEALYEIDRYEEAEQCAHLSLTSAEGAASGPLKALIGKTWIARNDLVQAERWLFEALGNDASLLEARYGLGLCQMLRGNAEDAWQIFEGLFKWSGGMSLGSLGCGLLAAERGELKEAIQHLSEAVRYLPGHGAAHLRLGECLFVAGRPTEALSYLERASELGYSVPDLNFYRGLAAFHTGDLETARARLRQYGNQDSVEVNIGPY